MAIEYTAEFLARAKAFGLTEDETKRFCTALGRMPTHEELAVCGALWSEHCSYKSSRVHLKRFHTQEPWVLQGPGENAGVVAITDEYGVAFKMESHNHPSYIEPYQGAATGVGGILRDVFCMGADPIASLNCLRFGEGAWNSKLLKNVVRGIGDYGNAVGVPTVMGETSFDARYSKNILVNAFTAGLVHKDKIYLGVVEDKASSTTSSVTAEGNILVYFGSATGRDGVHGATMSSDEFAGSENQLKPTVQVGDPFAEKILMEATFALLKQDLVVGLQDMGAAGLTSSSVEMAGRSGCGIELDLDAIPLRAGNMQGWEILLSESQERMLCAVTPQKLAAVLKLLGQFDVAFGVVGQVNTSGLFTCRFAKQTVVALPVHLLVEDVPRYEWPLQDRGAYLKDHEVIQNTTQISALPKFGGRILGLWVAKEEAYSVLQKGPSLQQFCKAFPNILPDLFVHPSFASRAPLYQHYCSTVKGHTLGAPGALRIAAAGVVRLPKTVQTNSSQGPALAVAGGCEERWVELDPLNGSALSALKVARKIVAVGGIPLGMTDCLNFGSPRTPAVMRQFSDSVDGINLVAKELHIPIVSGNVSLNNQTDGKPIPPTPMIGMVGKVEDPTYLPASAFPYDTLGATPLRLYHVSLENAEALSSFGASLANWILGRQNTQCPQVHLDLEKSLWQAVGAVFKIRKPQLCFPVGHGGLLGSLVRCVLQSHGRLFLDETLWQKDVRHLLSEGNMGFVMGFEGVEQLTLEEKILPKGTCLSPLGTMCRLDLDLPAVWASGQEFALEDGCRKEFFYALQRHFVEG